MLKSLDQKADRLQAQEQAILEQLEGLQDTRAPSRTREEKMAGILAEKERLQRELQEAQETVWALGEKGRQSDPELARRAMEALQVLKSEDLRRRIEESKTELDNQPLNLALQTEKQIDQSIDRVAGLLRDFSPSDTPSGPESIAQAARDAATLLRELENLQRQLEDLRSQQHQTALSRRQSESAASGTDNGRRQDLDQLREGLARSRNAARGLWQRRAQGLGWSAEARSVYQELSRRQIEDFMQQPELWRAVLEPARELASDLVAQAETGQAGDSPLSALQQQPPERYKSMVETYYRSLSDTTEMRN
jgi:hypothetical protein